MQPYWGELIHMVAAKKIKDMILRTNKSMRLGVLLVPLYDILFYVLAFFGVKKYLYAMGNALQLLQSSDLAAFMTNLAEESIEPTSVLLGEVFTKLVGYSFLLIIFLIIIWSVSRYFIWRSITQKNFSLKCMLKSIPANALWLLVMSIPILIMFIPFYRYVSIYGQTATTNLPPELQILRRIFMAVIFMMFYFTNIMHLLLIRTEKVFSSMIKTFRIGISKAYPLLAGYAVVFGIIYIFMLIFQYAATAGLILDVLVILASLTWIKMFFHKNIVI